MSRFKSIIRKKGNINTKVLLLIYFVENILDSVNDNQDPLIDPNAPEAEDHPTGIKLRRIGYYTIPPMNELAELVDEDGSCFVDGFTIGRYDYGNVFFPDRFNVAGLDLDSIGKKYLNSIELIRWLIL